MTPQLSATTLYLLNMADNTEQPGRLELDIKATWPNIVEIHALDDVHLQSLKQPMQKIVLVLLPAGALPDLNDVFNEIALSGGRIFYLAVGGQVSGADYKRLIQSGNADWVPDDVKISEIQEIIERRLGTSAAPSDTKDPLILSFLPCAGGVGNSTLTIETAAQLIGSNQSIARKICLVDLDFQTSHICDYLDIEARLKIDEIIQDPHRLDSQLLEIYTSHHSSGIDVLAAPRNKNMMEALDVSTLDVLFGLIANKYEYILIDLPVLWSSWTEQVLIVSHGVIMTGVNTIPCLRQISETLTDVRHIEDFGGDIRVVINRSEISMLGKVARRNHVSSILEDVEPIFVRYTDAVVESANIGIPVSVAQPSHKFSHDIAYITKFCTDLVRSRAEHDKMGSKSSKPR